MSKLVALALGSVLLVAAGCSETGSGGRGGDSQDYSVAYKLAAIDGDISEEAEFQAVIDCIMATGIKGAETEEKVADTLVASWQASAQQESLLEWAQVFCSG